MVTSSDSEVRSEAIEAERRLHHQAVQPAGAARSGPVAHPDQAIPRHGPVTGRRAGRMEPHPGGPGQRSGGRAREDESPAALPSANARRAHPVSGREHAKEPSAGDRGPIRRPPWMDRLQRDHTEPEEVMGVIREFHDAMGRLILRFEATVGWFAGDGLMVWFNDPVPCPDPHLGR